MLVKYSNLGTRLINIQYMRDYLYYYLKDYLGERVMLGGPNHRFIQLDTFVSCFNL